MDEKTEKLWKTILGEIETEVSRANFLTLFKNTALLSLVDNIATIAVPSAMIMNLLRKRYQETIKKALEKHTKENIKMVFVPKSLPSSPRAEVKDTPLFAEPEKKITPRIARLRADYTFQTLAVSDSNRLAFESARTITKNLGQSYNPLFIYGPVGVGKTHLMQAIANDVFEKTPEKKIIYITSEEFTNEVVEAIRSNDTARMKRRFRSAQLLIIDDVQFIAGKDRVQEELFHTFNTLIDSGSQIVLSSDRPPSEIKKLEARLSSRFAGGLTVDVESPDFETRTAIVLIKAEKYSVSLTTTAARSIAEKEQDVRSLEGTLLRIITEATTKRQEITEDFIEAVLRGGKEKGGVIHPDEVIKAVCLFYNLKPTLLKGPKRDASLVKPRQIIMYLLKKELGLTLVEIGNLLGGRDHTTIMHGVGKMENLRGNTPAISEEIMRITSSLRG